MKVPTNFTELVKSYKGAEILFPKDHDKYLLPDMIRVLNNLHNPDMFYMSRLTEDENYRLITTRVDNTKYHAMTNWWCFLIYKDRSEEETWVDISVISEFEFTAQYMSSPLSYALETIYHILTNHCTSVAKFMKDYSILDPTIK